MKNLKLIIGISVIVVIIILVSVFSMPSEPSFLTEASANSQADYEAAAASIGVSVADLKQMTAPSAAVAAGNYAPAAGGYGLAHLQQVLAASSSPSTTAGFNLTSSPSAAIDVSTLQGNPNFAAFTTAGPNLTSSPSAAIDVSAAQAKPAFASTAIAGYGAGNNFAAAEPSAALMQQVQAGVAVPAAVVAHNASMHQMQLAAVSPSSSAAIMPAKAKTDTSYGISLAHAMGVSDNAHALLNSGQMAGLVLLKGACATTTPPNLATMTPSAVVRLSQSNPPIKIMNNICAAASASGLFSEL